MPRIGIRELKTRLSHYLRLAQAGQTIQVTDRGHVIAMVTSTDTRHTHTATQLQLLIERGLLHWTGGKPTGLSRRVHPRGKQTLTDLLLEDRR